MFRPSAIMKDCSFRDFTFQAWKDSKLKVKLVPLVEDDLKAPFSIATTPTYRGGRYTFRWIAPLYPYLSVKQGGIKYQFLNLWYDSTWDWTPVSWSICEHSDHYSNVQLDYKYQRIIYTFKCSSNICIYSVSQNNFFLLFNIIFNNIFLSLGSIIISSFL